MSNNALHVLLWMVGALLIIALAGPAPNLATLLVLVLLAGLVLAHWQEYVGLATGTSQTGTITSSTGGQLS